MITLFHAYARSGGTLLNRLLAAMKDVVAYKHPIKKYLFKADWLERKNRLTNSAITR